MASACTSDPRDLLAFKCPVFLGSSEEGFCGAQGFPPASAFLLTKTQDRLSWNRQSFSIQARPRKSPGTAQIHPSPVETDRTRPARTRSFYTRRIQTKPRQHISDIAPRDARGTIVMKQVQVFSGEPATWFGFPPQRTCFRLCRISKPLLSSRSTRPGITQKRPPLFQQHRQNPTVIPNPPDH